MKNVIVPMQNVGLVRRVLLELKEKFIKSNANKYTANIDVFCELEVRDASGKLVSYRKFKSKSFVGNFLAYLRDLFIFQAGAGPPSGVSGTALIGTDSNTKNPLWTNYAGGNFTDIVTGGGFSVGIATPMLTPFSMMAQANDDSYGIQIGTGTTSPTASDTALTSKIPNSSMTYSAMQVDSGLTNVSSNNVVFKLTRTFTNNTANTINVSEAGIVAKIFARDVTTNSGNYQPILMLHDTFTAQAVASGQVLTVRYTISITT